MTRWLKAEALADLAERTHAAAALIGRQAARITVRDTSSRWGSCASSGAIAYSWRLILAPEFVRAAVVAHEVAHLVHMNHGPAFHALADTVLGGSHQPSRRWLAAHGAALHWVGKEQA